MISDTSAWSGWLWIGSRIREHVGEDGRMAGCDDADTPRGDGPAGRAHAGDPAAVDVEARDLAVLDDVDPETVRGTRVPPGDAIVARDPAATLERGPEDRDTGRPATC